MKYTIFWAPKSVSQNPDSIVGCKVFVSFMFAFSVCSYLAELFLVFVGNNILGRRKQSFSKGGFCEVTFKHFNFSFSNCMCGLA